MYGRAKQAVSSRVRPVTPAEPGQAERYDSEYKRNGTANIFIGFEPLVGMRFTQITEHRTNIDWANYIKYLADDCYPQAEKI